MKLLWCNSLYFEFAWLAVFCPAAQDFRQGVEHTLLRRKQSRDLRRTEIHPSAIVSTLDCSNDREYKR